MYICVSIYIHTHTHEMVFPNMAYLFSFNPQFSISFLFSHMAVSVDQICSQHLVCWCIVLHRSL